MLVSDCINTSLAPFQPTADQPWNKQCIQHLFSRMSFGANNEEMADALQKSPTDLVDHLIDTALDLPLIQKPTWADWTFEDYENAPDGEELFFKHSSEFSQNTIMDMLDNGFRDKLALFWSNHFVTEYQSYEFPPALYRYYKLLQGNAIGNFRDFVYDIGLNPAMLFYLNNGESTKEKPNENYARELLELFTLGRDNGYTQKDIEEIARAITGWYTEEGLDAFFEEEDWDEGSKTIFGRTGNWNYEDVITILFEEKSTLIARHICTKIYKYFVNNTPDESIIDQLAATLLENDFELETVFRQLFKSEHFFDTHTIGTQIKEPISLLLSFIKRLNLDYETLNEQILSEGENEDGIKEGLGLRIVYMSEYAGQLLFEPPNVAGWQGYRTWINTVSLTTRWELSGAILWYLEQYDLEHFRTFAQKITSNSNDPAQITQAIVAHFTPKGFQNPAAYHRATIVFKSGIPENYFADQSWNLDWEEAPWQVIELIWHITKQPEFQLC